MGIIPQSDRTFEIDENELTYLTVAPGENPETQTAAGKKENGPQLNYDINGLPASPAAFTMPQGTGVPYFVSPMFQAGVGLFKDTDLLGRYMPKFKSDNYEMSLWGIGVKHGLKQWIPGISKAPIFNLSLLGAYTKINTSFNLNATPESIGAPADLPGDWDNQSMDINVSSFTMNLLASFDLPIVCFFGGLGFTTNKTELDLLGDYPVINVSSGGFEALSNPLHLEFNNTDGSKTKPRINLGMRLKFGVFTLHGDYTYANYSVATIGMGIAFR